MTKEERYKHLLQQVDECRKCELGSLRTNTVPGEGSLNAKIMFIGEAPGFNEDQKGRPFVGRAGKILDELLEHIHLKREDVYIANILKCRPPNNRNPNSEEIKKCTEYLEKQLEIIEPDIIIPLGNFSYQYIFKKYDLPIEKISQNHGMIHKIQTLEKQLLIMPMYHPAVATYNPLKKEVLIKDFDILKNQLETKELQKMECK